MSQHLACNSNIKFNQLVFSFYEKTKETTESLAFENWMFILMQKISHLSEKFIIIILNVQITQET